VPDWREQLARRDTDALKTLAAGRNAQ
jgi:hypothetical protein